MTHYLHTRNRSSASYSTSNLTGGGVFQLHSVRQKSQCVIRRSLPADQIKMLLYLHLLGSSYQQLAIGHPAARGVHFKTLQDHLGALRDELFGGDGA